MQVLANGQQMTVQIPAGATPGQNFTMQINQAPVAPLTDEQKKRNGGTADMWGAMAQPKSMDLE